MPRIAEVEVRSAWRTLAEGHPVLSFIKEECYFPTTVKVDEEFVMKFLCGHEGPACSFWLGFTYKGKDYIFTELDGVALEEGQGIRIEFAPVTMRKFLEEQDLEKFDSSKTIEIDFKCGFIGDDTHYWTDSLTYSCYVEVPAFVFPWWGWMLSGVAVLGIVVAATKPWK